MVEIRYIPEGVRSETSPGMFSRKSAKTTGPVVRESTDHLPSFEIKKRATRATSDSSAPRPGDYHAKARGAIDRMHADNRIENRKVRPRDVRRWISRALRESDPTMPADVLEIEIEKLMPRAMAHYRGATALAHEIPLEAKRIREQRREARKRDLKANSARRCEEEYKRKMLAKKRPTQ